MLGGTAAFLLATSIGSTSQPAILSLGVVCASAAYLGLNTVFIAFGVAVLNDEAYSLS